MDNRENLYSMTPNDLSQDSTDATNILFISPYDPVKSANISISHEDNNNGG